MAATLRPSHRGCFRKPKDARGPLPAVLGLHDHGGNQYFSYRKITRTSPDQHPVMMKAHQEHYYGGSAGLLHADHQR